MNLTSIMFEQSVKKVAKSAIAVAVASAVTLSAAQAEVGNPRVNQVGYIPNGAKVASYVAPSNTAQTWQLLRNGSVVASGTTTPKGTDAASGDNIHHIDFSAVSATGEGFSLLVGGDESYPFEISADAFTPVLYDSIRYFYHNRSGIAIETQYTGGGNGSYAANAQWARPAGDRKSVV